MPFTTPELLNTVALSDPDPPLDDSVAVPIDPLVASSFSCTVKSVPLPAMLAIDGNGGGAGDDT